MSLIRDRHTRIATGLLIGFWSALFLATHLPVPAGMSDGWLSDKMLHFGAFGTLAFLCCWAVFSRRRKTVVTYAAILLAVFAYAAIDELLQFPVPTRHADFRDWLADVAGAGCGAAAFALLAALGREVGKEGQDAYPASAGTHQ